VASEPEVLLAVLMSRSYHFKRIGLEPGPLSQWLFSALVEADLPVICVQTRHMRAVLKAQINKTDRNDARGIVQMIRVGLYRPVSSWRINHIPSGCRSLRVIVHQAKFAPCLALCTYGPARASLPEFYRNIDWLC
jgi:transposase